MDPIDWFTKSVARNIKGVAKKSHGITGDPKRVLKAHKSVRRHPTRRKALQAVPRVERAGWKVNRTRLDSFP